MRGTAAKIIAILIATPDTGPAGIRRAIVREFDLADAAEYHHYPGVNLAAAGEFTSPSPTPPGANFKNVPAFCRVAAHPGAITKTPDIKIEVWMPASGWNGKFQAVGNGGWSGAIGYAALARALARGYATASTDTGHSGGSGSFALGHPEKADRFRVSCGPRDDRAGQGDRRGLLWQQRPAFLLEWLFVGRQAGAQRGAALSGRLRRHHRGRAGQLLDAPHDR